MQTASDSPPPGPSDFSSDLWQAVDRLIDRAPSLYDLRVHGLHLRAARRWRAAGRPIPDDLVRQEEEAAIATLTAPIVLQHVREAYVEPLIVYKGPAVASYYPDPAVRQYGDLDLIAPDARAAQQALIAAGFEEVGDPRLYVDIHHVRPLRWPNLPLTVEIHHSPKWPDGLVPPSSSELFAAASEEFSPLEGVLGLSPGHHAVLLAAHSWAHVPLRRALDLVDIAVVCGGLPPAELDGLARAWGITGPWRVTNGALRYLLEDSAMPLALRLWARNLPRMRERTVLENHLERLLSDFWTFPPRDSVRRVPGRLAKELRPAHGESRKEKLVRTIRAVRNAFVRRGEHDRSIKDREPRP